MTVALAGGATGGHLAPGVALAEAIRQRQPDRHILWMATSRPSEHYCLQGQDVELVQLPARPMQRGGLGMLRFAMSQNACLGKVFGLLLRRKPDVVIGLGGYASAAPVLAARMLGIPTGLLEQNAFPGKASRLIGAFADAICVPWDACADGFRSGACVHVTGNPVRVGVLEGDREKAARRFGLKADAPTLLVLGGSQGSLAVNTLVTTGLQRAADRKDGLQVIHCAGPGHSEAVRKAYDRFGVPAYVDDFVQEMGLAYALADMAVCRAGGTTIAELTAVGLPSILIPFPFATENHQYFNALVPAGAGGAVIMSQEGLSADALWDAVFEIMDDSERLSEMRAASRSVGRPDAAQKAADVMLALTGRPAAHETVEPAEIAVAAEEELAVAV